jgi:hypothetical protein
MKKILNLKVFIAALILAAVLLCATFLYILEMRPAATVSGPTSASAGLTIIPAATSTTNTLTSTPPPYPPTAMPTPTPAPGEFAINVYVQVAAGVDALNLRAEPGLTTAPLSLAFNSEVFLVTKGPKQADGYTWWYLTASYDTSRAGWAAQDYLTVIPSP